MLRRLKPARAFHAKNIFKMEFELKKFELNVLEWSLSPLCFEEEEVILTFNAYIIIATKILCTGVLLFDIFLTTYGS